MGTLPIAILRTKLGKIWPSGFKDENCVKSSLTGLQIDGRRIIHDQNFLSETLVQASLIPIRIKNQHYYI